VVRLARILRLCVILLATCALVLSAGCSKDEPAEETTEAVESADAPEAPSGLEVAVDDEPMEAEVSDADVAATEDEADVDAATNDPVLGPLSAEVSWAYLTDMYEDNGYWYVVVDYIQVIGPEDDIQFVNQNPQLRTFPLAPNANLQVLRDTGSPDYDSVSVADFHTFQQQDGDELVEVTPDNGYASQLTQWWSP
jgi:hypothetical protein